MIFFTDAFLTDKYKCVYIVANLADEHLTHVCHQGYLYQGQSFLLFLTTCIGRIRTFHIGVPIDDLFLH